MEAARERSPERRRGRLNTSSKCRAVCSRLMCFGVHTPTRSHPFAPGQPSSQSDHVREFQAILATYSNWGKAY